ncbi:PTS HPr component phosphorylation site [Lachnospiraceae bacterium]|nr:PTS HPr component phosphorylation site [Lachnospiraceae bacterium]
MKKKLKVNLTDEKRIKDFFSLNAKTECDIDVVNEHSYVDGKSLLGVMSLNLAKPLSIFVHGEDDEIQQLVGEYENNGLLFE